MIAECQMKEYCSLIEKTGGAELAWINRDQAVEILEISKPQLRRDIEIVRYLEIEQFDYESRERGFTWESLLVLWEYRQLVRQFGSRKAMKFLYKRVEDLFNGREDKESGRESAGTERQVHQC